ncbi:MFS transporter [Streptomyces sp. 549]|uniref:MFS transporter n=1 Tax=Streptomyces sp. 549 TaxID=3049076 RepID=UPI0024C36A96|nr:MFS transporter [Streptomyces sp. 549]MDK1475253.1 MFS transporter [Streptomyces sp. 549]
MRRLYAYAWLEDFVLLYPVYAVLFTETGLSAAQISSLFVIWSVTAFALEIPSGLWADLFSRRRLLVLAPLFTGTGFALWTWWPSYPAFAAGFVLWGAGTALRSGTFQALAYEELSRAGARNDYARVIGRTESLAASAELAATALAAPVIALGGPLAVGAASVAVTLLCALTGATLPDHRSRPAAASAPEPAAPPRPLSEPDAAGDTDAGESGQRGYREVLAEGLREVRGSPGALRALLFVSLITGVTALDEYVPLLARDTGVAPGTVPLLVLLVTGGCVVGGWLAGRGARYAPLVLAAGACCLAAGALPGHPAGLALVAVAFGVFQWTMALADARLQSAVSDRARATVTSMAGFGSEVVAVLVFASYALGSLSAGPALIFAVAAVPYLLIAVSDFRQ